MLLGNVDKLISKRSRASSLVWKGPSDLYYRAIAFDPNEECLQEEFRGWKEVERKTFDFFLPLSFASMLVVLIEIEGESFRSERKRGERKREKERVGHTRFILSGFFQPSERLFYDEQEGEMEHGAYGHTMRIYRVFPLTRNIDISCE